MHDIILKWQSQPWTIAIFSNNLKKNLCLLTLYSILCGNHYCQALREVAKRIETNKDESLKTLLDEIKNPPARVYCTDDKKVMTLIASWNHANTERIRLITSSSTVMQMLELQASMTFATLSIWQRMYARNAKVRRFKDLWCVPRWH